MYNFTICIANINIQITTKYEFTKNFCKDYVAHDCVPDFCVSVTEQEIRAESDSPNNLGYLESLAVYRKIAENLARYDAFLMHASVLDVDGYGVAFCAKSGTGKTTHTLLWKTLFGDRCQIVNGDKPIIRFIDGIPYAFGTPYCGKENLSVNMKTPIKALGFINRSEKNAITRLGKNIALKELIKVCHIPKNSENAIKTIDLIGDFLNKTDIYNIYCNMEKEAAELSSKELLK